MREQYMRNGEGFLLVFSLLDRSRFVLLYLELHCVHMIEKWLCPCTSLANNLLKIMLIIVDNTQIFLLLFTALKKSSAHFIPKYYE